MAHLDLERQMSDGSWQAVELPILDMVCHIPAGTYRFKPNQAVPGGVRLQGAFVGHETISCSVGYLIPRSAQGRKPKRHAEVFWARRWK